MSHFRLAPLAQDDLDGIFDYTSRDSVSAADRFLEELKQRFRLLASQPLLGEVRDEIAFGLRGFSAGNYVIFYRPIRSGIEVARVIHAARDIQDLH
jgi:toxin ParE1/3/4